MGATTRRRAAVVLVLVALVGCGDDEPDGGGSVAASTTTGREATSTTVADPGTTTTALADDSAAATVGELADQLASTEEGHTGLEQLSLELLVVPEDLAGQSFTDAGYVPTEGPNACGVDVDAEHPASVLVGTGLVDADGRSVVEEIRVYGDVDAAAAAYGAHRGALGCGTDGAGTTVGEEVDVNDVVAADGAEERAVVSEDEQGVVIVALVGDAVLRFATSAPAATPSALDPREVAAFGVGKVLAALEAG